MTLDADDKTHAPRGSTKPAIRNSGLAVPILYSLYSSLPFSVGALWLVQRPALDVDVDEATEEDGFAGSAAGGSGEVPVDTALLLAVPRTVGAGLVAKFVYAYLGARGTLPLQLSGGSSGRAECSSVTGPKRCALPVCSSVCLCVCAANGQACRNWRN